jgi:hypothetical protein
MWDYNIGLVRITPFFKSCNYSKVCCSCPRQHNVADGTLDNASEGLECESRSQGN